MLTFLYGEVNVIHVPWMPSLLLLMERATFHFLIMLFWFSPSVSLPFRFDSLSPFYATLLPPHISLTLSSLSAFCPRHLPLTFLSSTLRSPPPLSLCLPLLSPIFSFLLSFSSVLPTNLSFISFRIYFSLPLTPPLIFPLFFSLSFLLFLLLSFSLLPHHPYLTLHPSPAFPLSSLSFSFSSLSLPLPFSLSFFIHTHRISYFLPPPALSLPTRSSPLLLFLFFLFNPPLSMSLLLPPCLSVSHSTAFLFLYFPPPSPVLFLSLFHLDRKSVV